MNERSWSLRTNNWLIIAPSQLIISHLTIWAGLSLSINSIPTSRESLHCPTMAFAGTWQIYAQENLEPFLKALGKWLLPPHIDGTTAFPAVFPRGFSLLFLLQTSPAWLNLFDLIWMWKEAKNCINWCRKVIDNPQTPVLMLDQLLKNEEPYQKWSFVDWFVTL